MVWWWNPGNVLAEIILPVINVFTQSMHGLINAIAQLTPGGWFLRVFNMMGTFVMTIGANSCNVVAVLARSVNDFLTDISPMQKVVGGFLGVFCYFKDVVQASIHDVIKYLGAIRVAQETIMVKLAEVRATVTIAEIQNAGCMAMLKKILQFLYKFF